MLIFIWTNPRLLLLLVELLLMWHSFYMKSADVGNKQPSCGLPHLEISLCSVHNVTPFSVAWFVILFYSLSLTFRHLHSVADLSSFHARFCLLAPSTINFFKSGYILCSPLCPFPSCCSIIATLYFCLLSTWLKLAFLSDFSLLPFSSTILPLCGMYYL